MSNPFRDLDWPDWFHKLQSDKASWMTDAITDEWITAKCRVASNIAVTECPNLPDRYRRGTIDAETVANVVTDMVARVAMYSKIRSESNGTYTVGDQNPLANQSGFDPSPNLYLKKTERNLLSGGDDSGPIGTIGLGLSRMWGG
ncbi:MAG: hypothetical protein J6575_03495 [Bifidobacterium sp.]|nr:hypothetical protein [Bifidobacterium sp.]